MSTAETGFAAGSTVVVPDEGWIVPSCEGASDGWRVRCNGSSGFVGDTSATFDTAMDNIDSFDPADAELVLDEVGYLLPDEVGYLLPERREPKVIAVEATSAATCCLSREPSARRQ